MVIPLHASEDAGHLDRRICQREHTLFGVLYWSEVVVDRLCEV